MIMKIVNVKINNDFGKTLYFDCNNFNLKKNLTVIVNTERGLVQFLIFLMLKMVIMKKLLELLLKRIICSI